MELLKVVLVEMFVGSEDLCDCVSKPHSLPCFYTQPVCTASGNEMGKANTGKGVWGKTSKTIYTIIVQREK